METFPASDWLTENAAQPLCQWKSANAALLVLIHLHELVFTVSTTWAIVRVRERPWKR